MPLGISNGELPTHFCAYSSVHSLYDPTCAPAGKHTFYLYGFAPPPPKASSWAGFESQSPEHGTRPLENEPCERGKRNT